MINRDVQIEIIKSIASRDVRPLARWKSDSRVIKILTENPEEVAAKANPTANRLGNSEEHSMMFAYA